jgi:hypothetical protein
MAGAERMSDASANADSAGSPAAPSFSAPSAKM